MHETSGRLDDRSRPTIVTVTGLAKTYGSVVALDNIAFAVRRGEILGLIGPNGAGKTTLFECLAGVQAADKGAVAFGDGHETACRGDVLFYLPDGIAPWPHQSVAWGLRFFLDFFGGRQDLYEEVVGRLDIKPLVSQRIGDLSQGQRKRAMLAMALLTPQPVLLIDEPFEGLDLRQSRETAKTLRWDASLGRTLFVSIHQISDAGRICDRFVLLSGGHVCGEGTAAELASLAGNRPGFAAPADFEEIFLALT